MNKVALLIGVNFGERFHGRNPMPCINSDLLAWCQLLESRCGFEVNTLCDQQASRDGILTAIQQLPQHGYTLVAFFGAHYLVDGEYSFVPATSRPLDPKSFIRLSDLERFWTADSIKPRRVLGVFETLPFSDIAQTPQQYESVHDQFIQTCRRNALLEVIFSRSADQVFQLPSRVDHGALTFAFVRVLEHCKGDLNAENFVIQANAELLRANPSSRPEQAVLLTYYAHPSSREFSFKFLSGHLEEKILEDQKARLEQRVAFLEQKREQGAGPSCLPSLSQDYAPIPQADAALDVPGQVASSTSEIPCATANISPCEQPQSITWTIRYQQILLGYQSGQKQVAWTRGLDAKLRQEVHSILAAGVMLDEKHIDSCTFFRLSSHQFVLAVGLRGMDQSGRSFPAYHAFLISSSDMSALSYNPFPVYRALLSNGKVLRRQPEKAELPIAEITVETSYGTSQYRNRLDGLMEVSGSVMDLMLDLAYGALQGVVIASAQSAVLLEAIEALMLLLPVESRWAFTFSTHRSSPFDRAIKLALTGPEYRSEFTRSGLVVLDLHYPNRARKGIKTVPFAAALQDFLASPQGVERWSDLDYLQAKDRVLFQSWTLDNWCRFFTLLLRAQKEATSGSMHDIKARLKEAKSARCLWLWQRWGLHTQLFAKGLSEMNCLKSAQDWIALYGADRMSEALRSRREHIVQLYAQASPKKRMSFKRFVLQHPDAIGFLRSDLYRIDHPFDQPGTLASDYEFAAHLKRPPLARRLWRVVRNLLNPRP